MLTRKLHDLSVRVHVYIHNMYTYTCTTCVGHVSVVDKTTSNGRQSTYLNMNKHT